jgi:hypothetical protein
MKAYLDLIIGFLTLLTLVSGLYFAIRRFGLKRERYSFLKMDVEAKVIEDSGDMVLVSIVIHLENKGETRINARRERRPDGYLYNDGWDQCLHAGTLKIRAVPSEHRPLLFDWYSLKPLSATISWASSGRIAVTEGDLEQINYLAEYGDPEAQYKEVDFWIEPREVYDLQVAMWLPPGIYRIKALFIGNINKYQEEEYWSCTNMFRLKSEQPAYRGHVADTQEATHLG